MQSFICNYQSLCFWIFLPLCAGIRVPDMGIQLISSVFNRAYAHLAMDTNTSTCSETGHQRGSWWVNKWDDPRNVTRVSVLGEGSAYQIRVGDEFAETGKRGGFENNGLCHFSETLEAGERQGVDCPWGMRGRVVSIQSVDPTSSDRLKLCEVIIDTI